ncbi:MAG: alpha/beta hydrolase, partial [Chitinophagaceae bacterium]
CIDVFPSSNSGSKTLIFIHGGYWQHFDKSLFHFVAGAFADYGITTVLLNYPLIPEVSIDDIVASCRKSLIWLKKNLRELNGDPLQMYLVGHSAGGHLAAMLLENKWVKNNLGDSIKGVCSLSGLFNLKPIQQSNLNPVLNLTREITERNSPVNLEPTAVGRLLLFVGSAETQEYKDQSEELFNTWKNKVSTIDYSEITGLNHFSTLNSILDPFSLIHHSICKMMHL